MPVKFPAAKGVAAMLCDESVLLLSRLVYGLYPELRVSDSGKGPLDCLEGGSKLRSFRPQ